MEREKMANQRDTQQLKKAFLDAYAEKGTVTAAATAVGINRWTHYDWMKKCARYEKDFARAESLYCDILEAELHRRGVEGWDEPVYQQGGLVGTVRKYDSTILIFKCKGHIPEKYRDRQDIKVTGPVEMIVRHIDRHGNEEKAGD
ncbi:terminase [Chloroflexota bacterium]